MSGKAYSIDLCERVVAAVVEGGMSCRRAAAHFQIGISTAVTWVRRFRETGSLAPRQIGGYKPKAIRGEHREWLLQRIKERDFTLRGLVAELAAEPGLKVDYRAVWNFVHDEKLRFKKSVAASERDRPDIARRRDQGRYQTRIILAVWCSSTRPGPRPTRRHSGAGRRAARGSMPRSRKAAGRP